MVGIFEEALPEYVDYFFSKAKRHNEKELNDICGFFEEGLKQLTCFYTKEDLIEKVSALMLWALQNANIADAESWNKRFITAFSKEDWSQFFNDYRHERIEEALIAHSKDKATNSIFPKDDDLDVIFMARLFTRMPLFPPDYQKYAKYDVCNVYESQHMVWWYSGQITLGSGSYKRSTPNFSAKKTWNGLRSYTSLLWIAIAIGVEEATLDAAFADMIAAKSAASKCSAVRKHIPYEKIHDLASKYLPDRKQVMDLSQIVEQVVDIRKKLTDTQLSQLTVDLEKEMQRTPVFDARDKASILAWFYPVLEFVLFQHGIVGDDLKKVVPKIGYTLHHKAMKG